MDIAFRASRYDRGEASEGDYINCPMTSGEYDRFHAALIAAERVSIKDFESDRLFEACLPIEELAMRGPQSLLFGPFKPVGLVDPRSGRRPRHH